LTDAGKLVAEEKTKEHFEAWKRIEAAVKSLKETRVEDYVKLSVAAKSYFLLKSSGGNATPEERSLQTPKFGWAVSADQFRDADRLLQSINLIPK
jgi:hypothetical protein